MLKTKFVSTLVQMGMQITSLETRGQRDNVIARKSGNRVELEIERLGTTSTRVRVDAGGQTTAEQILRRAEKSLNAS